MDKPGRRRKQVRWSDDIKRICGIGWGLQQKTVKRGNIWRRPTFSIELCEGWDRETRLIMVLSKCI